MGGSAAPAPPLPHLPACPPHPLPLMCAVQAKVAAKAAGLTPSHAKRRPAATTGSWAWKTTTERATLRRCSKTCVPACVCVMGCEAEAGAGGSGMRRRARPRGGLPTSPCCCHNTDPPDPPAAQEVFDACCTLRRNTEEARTLKARRGRGGAGEGAPQGALQGRPSPLCAEPPHPAPAGGPTERVSGPPGGGGGRHAEAGQHAQGPHAGWWGACEKGGRGGEGPLRTRLST